MSLLKVIRASAGSGKTFRLTNEFLELLFRDAEYFMHILAVTFTNKATQEMKSRIIHELDLLYSGGASEQLHELIKATGLHENAIRNRAGVILRKILHQYSRFSISTIDSFFQKVIRSFTHELGIQSGYAIELDTDMVISDLIERLLEKLEHDKSLLLWLIRYAETLIEQGGNWNFSNSITRLGKEIFTEEFSHLTGESGTLYANRDILANYQKELYERIGAYRKEYTAVGQQAIELIRSFDLQIDDFSRKEKGPAGFLNRIAMGEFKEPTAIAREAAADIQKWYTNASPKKDLIVAACNNGLLKIMQNAIELYEIKKQEYFTSEEILKNLFTLGILADLVKLLSDYCNENNVFLLAEAATFINQIISENDIPFIYEKTGYWYHHFMIDEFQDTSQMQWNNFKPLISNSLSQEFDNLIVGDVKQSIYRWRNSNWEILADGIQQDYPPANIGVYTLQQNWRSGRRIIEFNNTFFLAASDMLQHLFDEALEKSGYTNGEHEKTSIVNIYSDVIQKPGNSEGADGMVQIDFIPEDGEKTYEETVSEKLVQQLCKLQDCGYSLSQIAIITRKNGEAEQLADMLLRYRNEHHDTPYKFDIISDDALRLGSSSVVCFIVALLKYLAHPDDMINNYHILSDYINYLQAGFQDRDFVVPENKHKTWNDAFKKIIPHEFSELTGYSGRNSLTEAIQQVIQIFRLDRFEGETAYVQAFQDLVLEFSVKHSSDLIRFLEFWKETGIKTTIAAPAGQEAIRILTVHKAKGLEFDVVILPYCNWQLQYGRDTILWCDMKNVADSKFDILPVYYSTRLKNTGFSGIYFAELRRQYVDSLNLLYVSFTRAREALFIYCSEEHKENLTNVSDLVSQVLHIKEPLNQDGFVITDFQQYFDAECNTFRYGSLPIDIPVQALKKETEIKPVVEPIAIGKNIAERIRIAFQGKIYLDPTTGQLIRPVNQGKIMHEIFSEILHIDDIPKSIHKICLQGKLDISSGDQLVQRTRELLKDIQVLSWFAGNWKVLTEVEIILPDGQVKRPDRVLVEDNKAVIIDFKFGKHTSKADEVQVQEYAGVMKEMGYDQVEGYLWYVEAGTVKQVA